MVSASRPGIVDAGDGGQDLGRDLLVELDVLVKLLRHRATQRLDLTGRCSVSGRHGHHLGAEKKWLPSVITSVPGALHAFDQHLHGAVRATSASARCWRRSRPRTCPRKLILAGGLLGDEHDLPASLHGSFSALMDLGRPQTAGSPCAETRPHRAKGNSGSVMVRQVVRYGYLDMDLFQQAHLGREGKCKGHVNATGWVELRQRWPSPVRGIPPARGGLTDRRWCARRAPLFNVVRVGQVDMVSIRACSMMERRPRAPVLRASALRAMAPSADGGSPARRLPSEQLLVLL